MNRTLLIKIEDWKDFLISFDIDQMFSNEALRGRALDLFYEGACQIRNAEGNLLRAKVRGRSDIYSVELRKRRNRDLCMKCNCPSRYLPCKHIGALLYTLQKVPLDLLIQNWAEAAGRNGEDDNDKRETGVPCPPGTVIRIKNVISHKGGNPGQEGKDFFLSSFFHQLLKSPISDEGKYRLAFKIICIGDFYHTSESSFYLKPVLVYLRKDGSDGRLEPFNQNKCRIPADEYSDKLLQTLFKDDKRSCRFIDLLRKWYYDSYYHGKKAVELPLEIYLERISRIKREARVIPRRLIHISITWKLLNYRGNDLYFVPIFSLSDDTDYSEQFSQEESLFERGEDGLVITNHVSGSLWYSFDLSIEKSNLDFIDAVGSLLELSIEFNYAEASSFTKLCRTHFPECIQIDDVPKNIQIISLVPRPVVDIKQSTNELCLIKLQFRYGITDIRSAGKEALIPISPEQALSMNLETDRQASTLYIHTDERLEQHYALRLRKIFTSHNLIEDEFYPSYPGFKPDKNFDPFQMDITLDAINLLSMIGDLILSKGFEIRFRQKKLRSIHKTPSVRISSSGEDWFNIEAGFQLEDDFIPIESIPTDGLMRDDGRLIVFEAGSSFESSQIFNGRKTIHKNDLTALNELENFITNPDHQVFRDYSLLKEKLNSFNGLERTEVPKSFRGTLRHYQEDGLTWLWFLHNYELGGCLADDMGLGKTVQMLALLVKAREKGEMLRALVVCPVSTLENWKSEIVHFTPQFSIWIQAGPNRLGESGELGSYDVVLISYATLLRDKKLIQGLKLDYLVLDEAQEIKNPRSKRRKAIASIPAKHRIALSGTPVQNSSIELWSLIDILMPGILGSRSDFGRRYIGKVDSVISTEALEQLEKIIKPLILRRTKAAVAPELPSREELFIYAEASQLQANFYESLRTQLAEEVEKSICERGFGASGMTILTALLRLRQAAILPALVDRSLENIPAAKLDLLLDKLIEVREEGNKALVFSQFTSVLDEIEERMSIANILHFRFDGSTPQNLRQEEINSFQALRGPAIFLISLKAGGLGINLTSADYVFLTDPWWNPAVESQAIDRAHRIGRRNAVFAYRLICRGTIEEKILRLQEKKKRLVKNLIHSDNGLLQNLNADDVKELFCRD